MAKDTILAMLTFIWNIFVTSFVSMHFFDMIYDICFGHEAVSTLEAYILFGFKFDMIISALMIITFVHICGYIWFVVGALLFNIIVCFFVYALDV